MRSLINLLVFLSLIFLISGCYFDKSISKEEAENLVVSWDREKTAVQQEKLEEHLSENNEYGNILANKYISILDSLTPVILKSYQDDRAVWHVFLSYKENGKLTDENGAEVLVLLDGKVQFDNSSEQEQAESMCNRFCGENSEIKVLDKEKCLTECNEVAKIVWATV